MRTKMRQYDTSDLQIGNINILEAEETADNLAFNESYAIIGDRITAKKIHATYDLTVLADLHVDEMVVNGDLFVNGNIVVKEKMTCHGRVVCTGEINADEITIDGGCVAYSISGTTIRVDNGVFAQITAEADGFDIEDGYLFAGEGVIGGENINVKNIIVGEYCDINNSNNLNIIELNESEVDNNENEVDNIEDDDDISDDALKEISSFTDFLHSSVQAWSELEEEDLVSKIKEIIDYTPDLNAVGKVVDKIIDISYKNRIDNLCDYLYVVWANNVFLEELKQYETLEPVFTSMLDDATARIEELEYRSSSMEDLSNSLYVIQHYKDDVALDFDICADRIFSSIGLRYGTVLNAWRNNNG